MIQPAKDARRFQLPLHTHQLKVSAKLVFVDLLAQLVSS